MSWGTKFKNLSSAQKTVTVDLYGSENGESSSYPCIVETDYVVDTSLEAVRLYNAGGKLQVYDAEKRVHYYSSNYSFDSIDCEFSGEPNVVMVKNNYEDALLFYDNNVAVFSNDSTEFQILKGSAYATVYGKLIQASGRNLYVFQGFNVSGGNSEIEQEFCFRTELEEGSILGVHEYDNAVMLLCKNKIIKLSFVKEAGEVTAQRVLTPYFNARAKSFVVCGDKAVFISEENLAIFHKNTLSLKKLPYGIKGTDVYTHCSSNGVLYVIPYRKDGVKRLLVYDVEEETYTDIECEAKALSKTGAFFVGVDGIVFRIERGYSSSGGGNSIDGSIDFGECGKKVLHKIEIHAVGNATLLINSEAGDKTYSIKDGCNRIYCNLCSEKFNFTFENKSDSFYVVKTTLTYAKTGG